MFVCWCAFVVVAVTVVVVGGGVVGGGVKTISIYGVDQVIV